MSKQETVSKALRALFATFGAEASADLLRGYVIGLGDLEAEQVRSAVFRAIRECDRLPRPAELRKLAGEVNDPEALAIAAWGDVLKAVPLGAWKSVSFDDVTINATIRNLGGWPTVIERFAGAEDEKWLRIEFVRTYKAMAARGVDGDACRPLPGRSEKQVAGGRIVDPIPVLIGCEDSRAKISQVAAGLMEASQ